MQIIQGDVILQKVSAIPQEAEERKADARGIVLAEGEVTGHYHAVAPTATKQFYVGEQMFIRVDAPVDLVHQEHDTITIPPGEYSVGIAREYDPFAEEARRVAD